MRIILFTLSICFLSCGVRDYSIEGLSDRELLELAYKENSSGLLNVFFNRWSNSIEPITPEEVLRLSDTLKAVHEIFRGFYNPFQLSIFEGFEYEPDYYDDVDWAIIDARVTVRFVKRFYSDIDGLCDSNTYKQNNIYEMRNFDFWPSVNFPGKQIVYLTDGMDSTISAFLVNDSKSARESSDENEGKIWEESKTRLRFLNRMVKIVPGHWGLYWHIDTHPSVRVIEFNKNIDSAIIRFGLIYQGGETVCFKRDGEWKILHPEITWQE